MAQGTRAGTERTDWWLAVGQSRRGLESKAEGVRAVWDGYNEKPKAEGRRKKTSYGPYFTTEQKREKRQAGTVLMP